MIRRSLSILAALVAVALVSGPLRANAQIIPDMLVTIARGGNVAKAAKKADRAIAGKLNG